MKIKLTRKQVAILILIIIITPIIYNKISGVVMGTIMQQMMRMPKEVVIDTPTNTDTFISAEQDFCKKNILTKAIL